jgi:hypothetical protein
MTDIEEAMDDEYLRVLAIDAAAQAETLLNRGGAWEALIEKARAEALGALNGLISFKFTDLQQVKEMQWQVTRYESLCRWIRDIEEAGAEAREGFSDEEVDELKSMFSPGETEPKDA